MFILKPNDDITACKLNHYNVLFEWSSGHILPFLSLTNNRESCVFSELCYVIKLLFNFFIYFFHHLKCLIHGSFNSEDCIVSLSVSGAVCIKVYSYSYSHSCASTNVGGQKPVANDASMNTPLRMYKSYL